MPVSHEIERHSPENPYDSYSLSGLAGQQIDSQRHRADSKEMEQLALRLTQSLHAHRDLIIRARAALLKGDEATAAVLLREIELYRISNGTAMQVYVQSLLHSDGSDKN